MSGGSKIVGLFGPSNARFEAEEVGEQRPTELARDWVDDRAHFEVDRDGDQSDAIPMLTEADPPIVERPSLLLPMAFALAGLLWIAFVIVAAIRAYAGSPPTLAELGGLIATASAPLALIAVGYLLVVLAGGRRLRGFAADAAMIHGQTAAIEARLATLAAQAGELRAATMETAGDLDQVSGRLGERIGAIATGARDFEATTGQAGERIALLLDHLPEADDRVRRITATLEEAMLSAADGTATLEDRVARIGSQAGDSEQAVTASADRLSERLRAIDAQSDDTCRRIDASADALRAASDAALASAAAAAEASQRDLDAQAAAMTGMADAARAAIAAAAAGNVAALGERMSAISAELDAIGARLAEHDGTGAAMIERLSAGLSEVERRIEAFGRDGVPQAERLGAAIGDVADRADRMSGALANGSSLAETLLGRAELLLVALDANAREIDETLPAALARLDAATVASQDRIASLTPTAADVAAHGERLLAALTGTETLIVEQQDRLDGLAAIAGDTERTTRAIVEGSGPKLVETMVRVREAATLAADRARAAISGFGPDFAQAIEQAGGALPAAIDGAVARAARAADALGTRVAQLDEATRALDARLGGGEEDAGDSSAVASREGFARRIALIIDALNAASVDMARILSSEPSEADWARYLSGERGLFTRRAVALIDADDANRIADRIAADPALHAQVVRFISDVETMLRGAIATRDGATLGITLLSSDIGKLYAALVRAMSRSDG